MLNNCEADDSVLPATVLYNEGWMIRVVLDWFSKYSDNQYYFSFIHGSKWYSEALLPSIFLAKYQGDKLAESWTHADAIIGDFKIGNSGKGDLEVVKGAEQFVVIEAKMFSKLSGGTTNIKNYDQATRTVACMAEILKRGEINPHNLEKLGFYVIAPSNQIEKEMTFKSYTNLINIKDKVRGRVEAYNGREDFEEKNEWFNDWFIPMLDKIDIKCLTWEDVIKFIQSKDIDCGNKVSIFYDKCLKYNQKTSYRL